MFTLCIRVRTERSHQHIHTYAPNMHRTFGANAMENPSTPADGKWHRRSYVVYQPKEAGCHDDATHETTKARRAFAERDSDGVHRQLADKLNCRMAMNSS